MIDPHEARQTAHRHRPSRPTTCSRCLEFWQKEIGLPFDHLLPIRKGQNQHRHDLLGSVLKINEFADPIPDRPPSGYHELLIARDGLAGARNRWPIRKAIA